MDSTSQSTKIIKTLRENNKFGTPNYKLSRISLKYSSRIAELRHDGHNIIAERVYSKGRWTGTWLYYLLEEENKPKLLARLKTVLAK